MKIEDKKDVAILAELHYNSISVYLKMLTIIRNICAHDEVLFNIRLHVLLSTKHTSGIYHNKLNINCHDNLYEMGINDLFSIAIIMKFCLEANDFFDFYTNLYVLLEDLKLSLSTVKFKDILDAMGFPENYKDLLNI